MSTAFGDLSQRNKWFRLFPGTNFIPYARYSFRVGHCNDKPIGIYSLSTVYKGKKAVSA